MNAQNAHEYLPLVRALANGETLEYYHKYNGWAVSSEIPFDMKPESYRIKPKPRSFKMWVHKNGVDIKHEIPDWMNKNNSWKRITVVEVIK